MYFSNPEDTQKSSHRVQIICKETAEYSFVSHLSAALRREGISPFVNTCLQDTNFYTIYPNQAVSVVVVHSYTVIEVNDPWSHMHIVVMKLKESKDYSNKLMRPIKFYGNALANTQERHRIKIMQEAGLLTRHKSRISINKVLTDSELVEEIVKDVYGKLYSAERVGIYSRLLQIDNLLYKQQRDVRSIGLWGMPGIGKTTLAKAVLEHLSTDYDASCFIENFDEAFHEKGPNCLLEETIGKVLIKQFDIKSSYVTRPNLYRDKICDKRILIVLDDVHDSLAAESFLGRLDWFGPGSLVVMTSIDKQVFAFFQINQIYEVQGLDEQEALQLFSENAFGKSVPEKNDRELSRKVVDYANGNPLALSIYGRVLEENKSKMEAAFLELKQCPPQKIHDVLRKAYNALDDNEKNIVLDIAFFFKGENVNYVVQLLEGCCYLPRIVIDVLVDKCVLTLSHHTVHISSLFQYICQIFFIGEIESSTRVLEPYSIKCLLEDDELKESEESSATPKCGLVVEDIVSIIFDTSNLKFDVKHDAFENMFNLRFLKIYNSCSKYVPGLNFPKGLDSLPCGLRLIHWDNYPLQSLPQDFDLESLTELCMPHSRLQILRTRTKNLKMLKRIRLCHSRELVEFDLPLKAQNVELIDLQGCTRLRNFPDTSQLQYLRIVNLSGCIDITGLQGTPPNIEELHLQGTSVRELPISVASHSPQKVKLDRKKLSNLLENFPDVEHIDLESVTELVKVSSYNQAFSKLVLLNMKDCSQLRSLPDMTSLESLQLLDLFGCSKLEEIKGLPRNMIKLYLGGTAIREMPQLPKSLEFLNAHDCPSLKSVSLEFEQLPRHYTFSNCFKFSSKVVAKFLRNGLARITNLTRTQEQEFMEAPEVNICFPAHALWRYSFPLQEGPRVYVTPLTLRPFSGLAMLVVVSFKDDYHNVVGLRIMSTCTWNTCGPSYHYNRTERLFQCWGPMEAPKVKGDHIFIFYDTKMQPCGSDFEFEFRAVSWENELLGDNCRVTHCGVQVITASTGDTIPSEITIGSEATCNIADHNPPISSKAPEATIPNPLTSSKGKEVMIPNLPTSSRALKETVALEETIPSLQTSSRAPKATISNLSTSSRAQEETTPDLSTLSRALEAVIANRQTTFGAFEATTPTFPTSSRRLKVTASNLTTSSRVLEETVPSRLPSREPRKVSSKLRSKGARFWKWMKTIRRNKKKKMLADGEEDDDQDIWV